MEQVFTNIRSIEEPLLAAIDGDSDGFLNSSKNTTNGVNLVDAEYYYLSNRLGSISAILDADNSDRILEYYRYEVFGSATVLPIVDNNTDGLEDTPLDLNDNNTAGPALVSSFGNTYLFTARRFDDVTGLYYYRNRYYDPRSGRFITRDPAETPQNNLYGYVSNKPKRAIDPLGLAELGEDVGKVDDCGTWTMTETKHEGGEDFGKVEGGFVTLSWLEVEIGFELNDKCKCECDNIRLLQFIKIMKKDENGNWVPDKARRQFSFLQRTIYYKPAYDDDGWAVDSIPADTPYKGSGDKPVLEDGPGWSIESRFKFLTCAYCDNAKENGSHTIFGCVIWGFDITAKGEIEDIFFRRTSYVDTLASGDDSTVKVWNEHKLTKKYDKSREGFNTIIPDFEKSDCCK